MAPPRYLVLEKTPPTRSNPAMACFWSRPRAIGLLTCLSVASLASEESQHVVERGPNHNVWERTFQDWESGRTTIRTRRWIQLENGLNYWDPDSGTWRESTDEIRLTRGGALALHGQHRAIFSANVNDPRGALDLELGPGVRLRSSVLVLRYFDPLTGRYATLAQVKNAFGELLPPNQVIYRDAFDGLNADVVYTYRRDGLEADVVLRELPPSPADFGLNPETARIEVVTQFFEFPEPGKTTRLLASVEDPLLRARIAAPDWPDDELIFGRYRMGSGRAFAWSAREAAQRQPDAFAVVGKQWRPARANTALLVESAEYVQLLEELLALPGSAERVKARREEARLMAGKTRAELLQAAADRAGVSSPHARSGSDPALAMERRTAVKDSDWDHRVTVASRSILAEPGLVLDWTVLTLGSDHFTFASTNTYHVTGSCSFGGTTTIEGGTVVKFRPPGVQTASLNIFGPLDCQTSAYRPAVFTAENDNTVGEAIIAGTPSPAVDYAYEALHIFGLGTPVTVQHLRFKHALNGIFLEGNNPDTRVRHCQFVSCRLPVRNTASSLVRLENVLITGVKPDGYAFFGAGTTFIGEHLTIHDAPNLLFSGTLTLTNSLVVAVNSLQAYGGSGNYEVPSASGLFQEVGGGKFYLASASPHRNAGVPDINSDLLLELRELTTHAPVVWETDFFSPTTLSPQAVRDMDGLDLGYHYPPLDYCLSGRALTYTTLSLADGVALGIFGASGITLGNGARLQSIGRADALNRLVYYNAVHEDSTNGWSTSAGEIGLLELANDMNPPHPQLHLEFTDAAMMADVSERRRMLRLVNSGPFELLARHAQLRGMDLAPNGNHPGIIVSLVNSLFEESAIRISQSMDPGRHPVAVSIFNNYFRAGFLELTSTRPDSEWIVRDNLFDSDAMSVNIQAGILSHNAFRSGLPSFGSNNEIDLAMDFVPGPLGPFSYPDGGGPSSLANLVNAGSRSASEAGLHHFSATIDYVKETNSIVDIGLHYATPLPTSMGLIGYWRLNEPGGSQAIDSSGRGFHGTLVNGPSRVQGQFGRALRFDGVNDSVSVPDSATLRLTNHFSLAFWVRRTGIVTDHARLIGKGQTSLRNYGVWLTAGPAPTLLFQFQSEAGDFQDVLANRVLMANRWYHVACTWDGSIGRIYIDGDMDVSGAMLGPPRISTAPLTFGYAGFLARFPGDLDEIVLYDRLLYDHEILALRRGGPADSDSDALPDVLEDRDGNGLVNPGELSFSDTDTDYDGISDSAEFADGTDPLDENSAQPIRLATWTFDDFQDPWGATSGAQPVERSGVRWIETAPPVHGVEITNTSAVLRYRDVEPNGRANINCRQGTIRIALSPYWASPASVCAGGVAGSGPGTTAHLLSVGQFALIIGPQGTNVILRTPDGAGGVMTNVQAPFRACLNEFPPDFPIEIQVTYSPEASAIFYNGALQARGSGIVAVPSTTERAQGLFIGSNPARTGQIRGIIDSLVTYNVPLGMCTNALIVTAQATNSPPSVTLSWTAVADCRYRIERRTLPLLNWVTLASVTPPVFTDYSAQPGNMYEYRLSADVDVPSELFTSTDPEYATALAGIELPPRGAPGHLLLVIDRSLTNSELFEAGVGVLTRDVWAEGWVVHRYDAPRHDDVVWANNVPGIAEVKSWVTSQYNALAGGNITILLLGHVPIPYSGMLSPDNHAHRPLPADGYYADVDGLWTDMGSWSGPPPNLPGDGIFDQELVPADAAGVAALEMAVSRVDFANMPAFANGTPPRGEIDLLTQYMEKARWFRRREITLPERVIYGVFFSANPAAEQTDRLGQHMTELALRINAAIAGTNASAAIKADFISAKLPAAWGIIGGFGGAQANFINSIAAVNAYHGVTPHLTPDLVPASGEPPVAFTMTEASFSSQWNDPDHLGRGLLSTRTNGLAWTYFGAVPRVEWQYASMAMGITIGEAWRKSQNDAWMWPLIAVNSGAPSGTGVKVFTESRSQGGHVYTRLLGDPTLRQAPPAPPGTLTGITNGSGHIVLAWNPSPDPGATYHVYRTANGPGSKWTQLTHAEEPSTSWTDTTPPPGLRHYMVRAMVLKSVASGSFTNISAGSIWP
jgi:hypothetical protein